MLRKLFMILLVMFCVSGVAHAQKNMDRETEQTAKGKKKKPDAFKIGEHVWVKMKDGSEQESVIHGHYKKNKYYVRKWHSSRQGLVHRKHMRHMTKEEIEAAHAKYEKKKKN